MLADVSIFSDPELKKEFNKYARRKHIPSGTTIMNPGDDILFIPIVMKGSIRVLRQDENGKEVFLYYLFPGQTCAMSLTCCQAGRKSMIRAVAEDEVEVVQIPVEVTESWYQYPEWKSFISNNYSNRFAELMDVIDLIAFNNMDKQLLHYLQERTKALNANVLEITHQQIADELHSHREAISRLLRTMEQKGLVRLGRNSVELI
jgi:CRP/FNR family transcriptional regulator, anaerobic regulatory protein